MTSGTAGSTSAPRPRDVRAATGPGVGDDVEADEPRGTRLDDWWGRMLSTPLRLRLWYWGGPAAVAILAAVLRFWNLGQPHALVFDETFYVKDADSLMHLGYEGTWPAHPDGRFAGGDTGFFSSAPEFVAHPELGKWIIALGLHLFGPASSVGWRFSTAAIGVLAVVLVMLLARRMLHSTALAVTAGLIMAIDGGAIVMSRVALLDNILMFVALLGFGCVLLDRPWHARRLEEWMARKRRAGREIAWGPMLWWRPWLLAGGAVLGLSAGVKWSGFYFLAIFAVYTVCVDAAARRRAGIPFWFSASVLKQGPATFLVMIPIGFAAYLATWASWIATSGGYDRHWVQDGGQAWHGLLAWVPLWAQNLWHYHAEIYAFNIGLHTPHPYQANPLTWLAMTRPTSMYYAGTSAGEGGCTHAACSSAITDIANPIIWWAAAAACLYLVYRLVRYREWQVGLALAGVAAGYLPWLLYLDRTVFQFYTIAFEPYLILGLTIVAGLVLGRRTDARWRRRRGFGLLGVFLAVAVLVSAFFYPLWTGMRVPYAFWQLHVWLPGWW